jgi:hypothetical protein
MSSVTPPTPQVRCFSFSSITNKQRLPKQADERSSPYDKASSWTIIISPALLHIHGQMTYRRIELHTISTFNPTLLHHFSPRAIPTSVLVTPTIRPERTTKSSARPNPQHRRLRSPKRPSATPHFAQRAIQLASQTRHPQHIAPNAQYN